GGMWPSMVSHGTPLSGGPPFSMPPTALILNASSASRPNPCPRRRRSGSTNHNQLQRIKLSKLCFEVSPPTAPLRRLRCHRGWLQDRHRFPPQTVRNVLDRPRRQLHHRFAVLSSQWSLRGLLGVPPRRLITISMSPAPRQPKDRRIIWLEPDRAG